MESLSAKVYDGLKRVPPSRIPTRGGATLTLWQNTEKEVYLILAGGSQRQDLDGQKLPLEFEDFWLLKIDKEEMRPADAYEIAFSDKGPFTARHSMAAVLDEQRQRIVYFGGINYGTEQIFNEMYILCH